MKCPTCKGAAWTLLTRAPGEAEVDSLDCPTCEGTGESTAVLVVQSQTRDEIFANRERFRSLTMPDPASDLNLLLDDILWGQELLLGSTVATVDDGIVGWATGEIFRQAAVVNVFVHPNFRRLGIGTQLVTLLLQGLPPDPKPNLEKGGFWERFR